MYCVPRRIFRSPTLLRERDDPLFGSMIGEGAAVRFRRLELSIVPWAEIPMLLLRLPEVNRPVGGSRLCQYFARGHS
jgi:hypothetical protein